MTMFTFHYSLSMLLLRSRKLGVSVNISGCLSFNIVIGFSLFVLSTQSINQRINQSIYIYLSINQSTINTNSANQYEFCDINKLDGEDDIDMDNKEVQ